MLANGIRFAAGGLGQWEKPSSLPMKTALDSNAMSKPPDVLIVDVQPVVRERLYSSLSDCTHVPRRAIRALGHLLNRERDAHLEDRGGRRVAL
jgi:hypothetical protein